MAEGLIEFQHVWKKFRRGEFHDSLRDMVPALASTLFRERRREALERREFWAVQDVSFSVRPGRGAGNHRAERRRQVDDPQAAHPHSATDARTLRRFAAAWARSSRLRRDFTRT